jgi:hypothetical protein
VHADASVCGLPAGLRLEVARAAIAIVRSRSRARTGSVRTNEAMAARTAVDDVRAELRAERSQFCPAEAFGPQAASAATTCSPEITGARTAVRTGHVGSSPAMFLVSRTTVARGQYIDGVLWS